MVAVSSALSLLARGIIKIAKDLRLLASGPETGFGEICLPSVQPGSSIMPGKVNPVIPEFVIQLCFQVIGKHLTCEMALDHGELDLNIWESVIVFSILDSMQLLSEAACILEAKCIRELGINSQRNSANARTIIPLLTKLAQRHKYSTISAVCKEANGDMDQLRKALKEKGLL